MPMVSFYPPENRKRLVAWNELIRFRWRNWKMNKADSNVILSRVFLLNSLFTVNISFNFHLIKSFLKNYKHP